MGAPPMGVAWQNSLGDGGSLFLAWGLVDEQGKKSEKRCTYFEILFLLLLLLLYVILPYKNPDPSKLAILVYIIFVITIESSCR